MACAAQPHRRDRVAVPVPVVRHRVEQPVGLGRDRLAVALPWRDPLRCALVHADALGLPLDGAEHLHARRAVPDHGHVESLEVLLAGALGGVHDLTLEVLDAGASKRFGVANRPLAVTTAFAVTCAPSPSTTTVSVHVPDVSSNVAPLDVAVEADVVEHAVLLGDVLEVLAHLGTRGRSTPSTGSSSRRTNWYMKLVVSTRTSGYVLMLHTPPTSAAPVVHRERDAEALRAARPWRCRRNPTPTIATSKPSGISGLVAVPRRQARVIVERGQIAAIGPVLVAQRLAAERLEHAPELPRRPARPSMVRRHGQEERHRLRPDHVDALVGDLDEHRRPPVHRRLLQAPARGALVTCGLVQRQAERVDVGIVQRPSNEVLVHLVDRSSLCHVFHGRCRLPISVVAARTRPRRSRP